MRLVHVVSIVSGLALAGCTWIPGVVCGNGLIEGTEACDEGDANADDSACTATCTVAICGDGLVWSGVEDCDDGDANDGSQGCSASCAPAECGDGVVWSGVEDCDDGDANMDTGACTSSCTAASCGDDLVWAGVEDCDDGDANMDTGACTLSCTAASCGDGLVWAGVEDCDDGDDNADTGGCTAACGAARCGDGLVWSGVEDCDDGNRLDGDGCSPDCRDPIQVVLTTADAKLTGNADGNRAGWQVSAAGDVDGDGFDDMLVGAFPDADVVVADGAYLIRGAAVSDLSLSASTAVFEVDVLERATVFRAAGAGDVDGDGYDDVILGFDNDTEGGFRAGAAFLVHGPMSGTITLDQADAKLVGELFLDVVGRSVASGGDVDDDGFADVLVGGFGFAYLAHGPLTGTRSLRTAEVKYESELADPLAQFAVLVDSAGDVSGDGLDDVLLGDEFGHLGDLETGAAYLVVSPALGIVPLGLADARMYGEDKGDRAGFSIAGAGDVDGDGLSDVMVGAVTQDAGGYDAGAAYLLTRLPSGQVGLAEADARLVGQAGGSNAGNGVAGAGDVNGDGFADLLIGAPGLDDPWGNEGAAYVVLGPVEGNVDLANVALRLAGEGSGDSAGRGVAGVGDVDGDGLDDMLIGAPYQDAGGVDAGAAYLVRGGF